MTTVNLEEKTTHLLARYGHAMTSKWLLTRVPDKHTPFKERGWPFFLKAHRSGRGEGQD